MADFEVDDRRQHIWWIRINNQKAFDWVKNNFESDVLYAYDSLIPSSYKSDLFRYCILYKYGGIYLDIAFESQNNFKLIYLTNCFI